jgi:hypothetical protein
MAKKALRNLALLGGLGAAAYMMGKKKGEKDEEGGMKQSKEDDERDAREKALAGPLREMPKTETKKTETSKRETPPRPRPSESEASPTAPTRTAPASSAPASTTSSRVQEGATASGMPREARGVTRSMTRSDTDNPYYGRTVEQRAATLRAKGGTVSMKSGGSVKSSASKRADGCAMKGKTKGRMV